MIDAKMLNGAKNFDVYAMNSTSGQRITSSFEVGYSVNSPLVVMNYSKVQVVSTIQNGNDRLVTVSGGIITVQQTSMEGLGRDIEATLSVKCTNPVSNTIEFSGDLMFRENGVVVDTFAELRSGKYTNYKQGGANTPLTLWGLRYSTASGFINSQNAIDFSVASEISR